MSSEYPPAASGPPSGARRSPDYEKGRERGGVPSSQPPHISPEVARIFSGAELTGRIAREFGDEVQDTIREAFVNAGMENVYAKMLADFQAQGIDPNDYTAWKLALHGASRMAEHKMVYDRMSRGRKPK